MPENHSALMNSGVSATLLLQNGGPSRQDRCVTRLLEFFSVSSRVESTKNISSGDWLPGADSDKVRVICSAKMLLGLIQDLGTPGKDRWIRGLHSVFVYPDDDLDALRELVKLLVTGAEITALARADGEAADYSI